MDIAPLPLLVYPPRCSAASQPPTCAGCQPAHAGRQSELQQSPAAASCSQPGAPAGTSSSISGSAQQGQQGCVEAALGSTLTLSHKQHCQCVGKQAANVRSHSLNLSVRPGTNLAMQQHMHATQTCTHLTAVLLLPQGLQLVLSCGLGCV
jgi:hypothetical protein